MGFNISILIMSSSKRQKNQNDKDNLYNRKLGVNKWQER